MCIRITVILIYKYRHVYKYNKIISTHAEKETLIKDNEDKLFRHLIGLVNFLRSIIDGKIEGKRCRGNLDEVMGNLGGPMVCIAHCGRTIPGSIPGLNWF